MNVWHSNNPEHIINVCLLSINISWINSTIPIHSHWPTTRRWAWLAFWVPFELSSVWTDGKTSVLHQSTIFRSFEPRSLGKSTISRLFQRAPSEKWWKQSTHTFHYSCKATSPEFVCSRQSVNISSEWRRDWVRVSSWHMYAWLLFIQAADELHDCERFMSYKDRIQYGTYTWNLRTAVPSEDARRKFGQRQKKRLKFSIASIWLECLLLGKDDWCSLWFLFRLTNE